MNNYSFAKPIFTLTYQFLFFCLSVGFSGLHAADVPVIDLKGHTEAVNFSSFSPDDKMIVTASADHTARIWDVESGKELRKLEGHTDSVNSASFSPDGTKIVTASWDTTARIWDVENGQELIQFSGKDGVVNYLVHNPLVVLGGTEPLQSIRFASFSPDGKEIVVVLNLSVRILDAESGEELRCLRGHLPGATTKAGTAPSYSISSAVFSPDGEKLATAGIGDHRFRIWDVKSGGKLYELPYSGFSGARCATFSPDGKRIVGGSGYGEVLFWDADSGKRLKQFDRHRNLENKNTEYDWLGGAVYSVNFSSDGKRIIIASEDKVRRETPDGNFVIGGEEKTPRIVDVESGEELQKLEGHTDQVLYAAFSPNGKKIVTACHDGVARIWNLE